MVSTYIMKNKGIYGWGFFLESPCIYINNTSEKRSTLQIMITNILESLFRPTIY